MLTIRTSRRHWLSLGLLTCASAAVPSTAFATPALPAWLAAFAGELAKNSVWVQTERGIDGELELHCGIRDAAAWSKAFSSLAGTGRVHAQGNILTFSKAGCALQVIMHPTLA
ncbi:MAG: hypothetical protein V4675_17850 [Verrucomicrobiota bacterium]